MNNKTIVFLEKKEHVLDYLKQPEGNSGKEHIMALSPFAMYELENAGVEYHIPEEYYQKKELYNLGMENYKKTSEICRIIDKYIYKINPFAENNGISPAFFSFFYMKTCYDAVTLRVFQLSRIIDAEKPEKIVYYKSDKLEFGTVERASHILFDNKELVYSRILDTGAWNTKMQEIIYVGKEEPRSLQKKIRDRLVLWLQAHPNLMNMSMNFKEGKMNIFPKGKKPLLVFGWGYDWDECDEEFERLGFGPVTRIRDNLRYWSSGNGLTDEATADVRNQIAHDRKLRNLLVYDKVDFYPIMEPRIRFLLDRITPACIRAYENTSRMIDRKKITAMLFSTMETPAGKAAAMAARNRKIPVITWQHGAHGNRNDEIIKYMESIGCTHYFNYGIGAMNKYSNEGKKYGFEVVAIGSSKLDKINEGKTQRNMGTDKNKKTILYVTSHFYQNNLYITNAPGYSDNEFWMDQKKIIDALGNKTGYNVLVKLHSHLIYDETPLRRYADKKEYDCTFIRNEQSFVELLPEADIIVGDLPSTTLLESLTTHKPVFVLTKHLELDNEANELLKKRAYCFPTIEEFTTALNIFLSTGKPPYEVDLNNREFLMQYGTYLDDGKSANRAVEFLDTILKNK